jgi:sugar O-acyltransferase (sialic acid O-acetyltransferase NeuD family)
MTESIVLVGGGGHCRSCIEVLEKDGYRIAGVLEKESSIKSVLNIPVIGDDEAIAELISKNQSFLITIGQIKNSTLRVRLYEKVKSLSGRLVTVISSSSAVSKHSEIGEGTIIMQQAIVNAGVIIGRNCIINNKALIEHDCLIDDHAHISTAAIINGGCKIGKRVFIGSNSVLAQEIRIGDDVVIGAGSVVVKSIEEAGTYAGNPAKKIN